MPNWCIGHVLIEGQFSNVKRFFKEGITITGLHPNLPLDEIPQFYQDGPNEDSFFIRDISAIHFGGCVYINDTSRHFLGVLNDPEAARNDGWVEITRDMPYHETNYVSVDFYDCEAAWSWCAEELSAIAAKYSVAFTVEADEEGCGFHQYIVIGEGGDIIEDYTEDLPYEDEDEDNEDDEDEGTEDDAVEIDDPVKRLDTILTSIGLVLVHLQNPDNYTRQIKVTCANSTQVTKVELTVNQYRGRDDYLVEISKKTFDIWEGLMDILITIVSMKKYRDDGANGVEEDILPISENI